MIVSVAYACGPRQPDCDWNYDPDGGSDGGASFLGLLIVLGFVWLLAGGRR